MIAPVHRVNSISTATAAPAGRRIVGIDLARALAIVGMVTVHVSPSWTDSVFEPVLEFPGGRSAILFGLLAGVGVTLLASSRSTSIIDARLTLLWRIVLLLPLGLALQTLEHQVFVILADYALLYLVAMVILRWSDRWVLFLGTLAATVGSVVYRYDQLQDDRSYTQPATLGLSAMENLDALVVSGPYPLITWTAPLCVGIWLGRRDLHARVVQWRMVVVGGAVAIATSMLWWGLDSRIGQPDEAGGWWPLLANVPHSQTPVWLVSATASAVAGLGLCLLLAGAWPRMTARLAAAGQLAFTWYVVHLLVLHVDEELLRTGTASGTLVVIAVFTVVMVVASIAWSKFLPRGPLEYALRPPWRGWSRRRAQRSRVASADV